MILVIDNYDSFTYNLVQYLQMCGEEVQVVRNDAISVDDAFARGAAGIMLSPGPCSPEHSGVCLDILRAARSGQYRPIPIFGVCLGHQAMGIEAGMTVGRAKFVRHGKPSMVEHNGEDLFAQMPNPFSAIRYHSLVIDESTLTEEYEITARSLDDGEIMGIRHKQLPLHGVQFHPESVLTENGLQIVRNFVEMTQSLTLR